MILREYLESYRRTPYWWLILLIGVLVMTFLSWVNGRHDYAAAFIQSIPGLLAMGISLDAMTLSLEKDAAQQGTDAESAAARVRALKLELEELQLKFEIETQRTRLAALRQSASAEGNAGSK